MMMTDSDMKKLDDLLARTAKRTVAPDSDLFARVLADAAALQPVPSQELHKRRSFTETLKDLIGGWPTLSGLATAGIAGLWFGIAPPAGLETLAAQILGTTEEIDLLGVSYDFGEIFDG